MIFLSFL